MTVAPSLFADAFVGRRVPLERHLVCAMSGQFPVLACAGGGELAIVFRSGAGHYGVTGTLATAWSVDGGRRWSDPIDVAPRGDDIRNPAFGVDAGGRWMLVYWKASVRCYPAVEGTGERHWKPEPATGDPNAAPETFAVISEDRGRSWSAPRPVRCRTLPWCSPFGRIVPSGDGSYLMAAYGTAAGRLDGHSAIVLRSADGLNWGDDSLVCDEANELSLCPLGGSRLAGALRTVAGATAIVHSHDQGRTWSAPVQVTRELEHPADLTVLRDSGRLLLTFGRRRRPLGCGALTSADNGLSWDHDHETMLAGDGVGNDVGYPSTVQLPGGDLVTALYFGKGSAGSDRFDGWGEVSCQALRYPEALVVPPPR